MKSAKQIASDMADAINIDSNLVRGFAQGFISVPVDFYYLGYDYIDNENRWLNSQDKERFIRLMNVAPLRGEHGSAAASTVFKIQPHLNASAV